MGVIFKESTRNGGDRVPEFYEENIHSFLLELLLSNPFYLPACTNLFPLPRTNHVGFARVFFIPSFLVLLQSIGWLLSSFIRAVVDWLVGHKSTISIGFGDW